MGPPKGFRVQGLRFSVFGALGKLPYAPCSGSVRLRSCVGSEFIIHRGFKARTPWAVPLDTQKAQFAFIREYTFNHTREYKHQLRPSTWMFEVGEADRG